MCNFLLDVRDVETRFDLNFGNEFAAEIEGLREHEKHGFVQIDEESIQVTSVGRVFIRNIAMTFDQYLKKGSDTQKTFSKTI